jgi:hypothetical protein
MIMDCEIFDIPEPLESRLIEELNKIIKSVEKKSGSKRQEERIDNET